MTGRPRDLGLEKRLIDATWSLLVSDGYESLTLSKVAALAQAHRTDVYRRWATKAQLVTDALPSHIPPVLPVDTGTLLGDIRAYVSDLAQSWSSDWILALVGLLADLPRDAEAELAFRTFSEGRGLAMRDALRRAVERGELAEMPDPQRYADFFEGPLMHRRLIAMRPLTEEFLDVVAAQAHLALTTGVTA